MGSTADAQSATTAVISVCVSALLGSENSDVQEAAAGSLTKLASHSQLDKDVIVAAGAGPMLVALLRSHQPDVQAEAAGALENFAAGSQQNSDAMLAAGACFCSLLCWG